MSTAFFPTNMRHQSSGGYSNHSSLQNIPYLSWKGRGIYRNPVGITSTHIRPLTNNDPTNDYPSKFGLPRPIKHYRKGTGAGISSDRVVKSSLGSSLGGGGGGAGLIAQWMDQPGLVVFKSHTQNDDINQACDSCHGVTGVSSWMPITNLTEKPQANVTNPPLCCNQQRKAIRRVLPTSTNVKSNYYQTTAMYLYNRCQTFKQRQFNFTTLDADVDADAGVLADADADADSGWRRTYVAQCNPNFTIERSAEIVFIDSLAKLLVDVNYLSSDEYALIFTEVNVNTLSVRGFIQLLQSLLTLDQYNHVVQYMTQLTANPYNRSVADGPSHPRGCARVYYKPNNPQFATQGAVSSSTRLLKLNVDTLNAGGCRARNAPDTNTNKSTKCQAQTFIGNPFFFQGQLQNKTICKLR